MTSSHKRLLCFAALLVWAAPPSASAAPGDLLRSWEGEAANDLFGVAVASAGDVDADGTPDVLIGASEHDGPAGMDSGKVYVFSGATGMSLQTWDGEAAEDAFGSSVAGAGDMNADGVADVVIGAPHHAGSIGLQTGKAYVYSGRDGTLLWTWQGEAPLDRFGESVAGAGDINQDGHADVIVGGGNRAFVYSGLTGRFIWYWEGEGPYDGFGRAVAGGDDVDGDGVPDLVIGAPGYHDASGSSRGKVYVFSGATGERLASWIGELECDEFGSAVALAGDANADGHAEVLASTEFHTEPEFRGKVYGFTGATGRLAWSQEGEAPEDSFGVAMAGAGDVNADGFDDFLIGANAHDHPVRINAGKAYVYSGDTGSLLMAWDGEQASATLGQAVAGIGDLNHDGYDDVLMAAAWHDGPAGPNSGKVYAYAGGPAFALRSSEIVEGAPATLKAWRDLVPGELVYFLGSRTGQGPYDDPIYGRVLLSPPVTLLGTARVSEDGVARLQFFVPWSADVEQPVYFQAGVQRGVTGEWFVSESPSAVIQPPR